MSWRYLALPLIGFFLLSFIFWSCSRLIYWWFLDFFCLNILGVRVFPLSFWLLRRCDGEGRNQTVWIQSCFVNAWAICILRLYIIRVWRCIGKQTVLKSRRLLLINDLNFSWGLDLDVKYKWNKLNIWSEYLSCSVTFVQIFELNLIF